MNPPVRGTEENIAVIRVQREHGATSFVCRFNQRYLEMFRGRQYDGFFSLLIYELYSMSALGNDPFYIVIAELPAPKLLARRLVYPVPQAPNNKWPFRVSILESNQYLVAFLWHEHEATVCAGVRGDHS